MCVFFAFKRVCNPCNSNGQERPNDAKGQVPATKFTNPGRRRTEGGKRQKPGVLRNSQEAPNERTPKGTHERGHK